MAVVSPTLAGAVAASVGTVVAALRCPQVVLAVGVGATLTSSQFGPAVLAGSYLLVLGGAVAAIDSVANRRTVGLWGALLTTTLGWLGFRLLLEAEVDVARAVAASAGALILALACRHKESDWVPPFAIVGLLFVAASIVLGSVDPTGLRLEGISGNPNRMVFGLLIFAPPMVAYMLRRVTPLATLAMGAGVVAVPIAILRSGSDQGIAGLAALLLAGALVVSRRLDRVGTLITAALGVTALALAGLQQDVVSTLSNDTLSLSGRTDLYGVAWRDFLASPFIGSGTLRVSEGLVVERSTHNSILGFAAATGIVGAVLWIAALVIAAHSALRSLRAGTLALASVIVVVVSQMVQSIELAPATWAILALAVPRKETV
ncbi:O-antigen ligase family protein [Aeromicrobium sp. CF4.19]|uniref:O-antigen ligase family protein n=1 Tax=Aeromicrobium sp. CF4.19 TaxID=3373082 RepID=UPI003EE50433